VLHPRGEQAAAEVDQADLAEGGLKTLEHRLEEAGLDERFRGVKLSRSATAAKSRVSSMRTARA